jgi:hypothetical protein
MSTESSEKDLDLLGKQLDRYQAIISRLANNGVQVKTWCVTVVAALTGVALNTREATLLLAATLIVFAFVVLDSYYLSLERHFRKASDRLAGDFEAEELRGRLRLLQIEGPKGGSPWGAVAACAPSLAVTPFYLGIAALVLVGALIITP